MYTEKKVLGKEAKGTPGECVVSLKIKKERVCRMELSSMLNVSERSHKMRERKKRP